MTGLLPLLASPVVWVLLGGAIFAVVEAYRRPYPRSKNRIRR